MKIQDMENSSEGYQPSLAEVVDFLGTQTLGVISTVDSEGWPQSATVAFSETQNCEIIIGTDGQSRKAQNIDRDERVAFVVTDAEERYTVQMQGNARVLSKEEFSRYAVHHFQKLPSSAPFKDIEGQVYIIIEPTWLRFSDCNPHPWVLTEHAEF